MLVMWHRQYWHNKVANTKHVLDEILFHLAFRLLRGKCVYNTIRATWLKGQRSIMTFLWLTKVIDTLG